MDERIRNFIASNPDAAMVTLRSDGTAHMARIEVAVVDETIWSSGSPALVRTRNLRRDPRCSLFVFASPPDPRWVGLETEVSLLDGPEAPQLHLRLMGVRHHGLAPDGMVLGHDDTIGGDRLFSEDEYITHVRAEERLIYQFDIRRAYGNY